MGGDGFRSGRGWVLTCWGAGLRPSRPDGCVESGVPSLGLCVCFTCLGPSGWCHVSEEARPALGPGGSARVTWASPPGAGA